jgi:hypothetical protein
MAALSQSEFEVAIGAMDRTGRLPSTKSIDGWQHVPTGHAGRIDVAQGVAAIRQSHRMVEAMVSTPRHDWIDQLDLHEKHARIMRWI